MASSISTAAPIPLVSTLASHRYPVRCAPDRIYPPRAKICKRVGNFQNDTTKTWTAHVQDLPAGTTPGSVHRVWPVPLARPKQGKRQGLAHP